MYNVQCTYMSNIGTTVERFNGQTTISLTGDKTHILKSTFLSSFSLSESVGRLYDNYEGLLDQFALFWGEVARTFAGSRTWNLLDCPIHGCVWILQMSTFWVTRSWTSRGAATSTKIPLFLCRGSRTDDTCNPCIFFFARLVSRNSLNQTGTIWWTRRSGSTTRTTWCSSSPSPGRSLASGSSLGSHTPLVASSGSTSGSILGFGVSMFILGRIGLTSESNLCLGFYVDIWGWPTPRIGSTSTFASVCAF